MTTGDCETDDQLVWSSEAFASKQSCCPCPARKGVRWLARKVVRCSKFEVREVQSFVWNSLSIAFARQLCYQVRHVHQSATLAGFVCSMRSGTSRGLGHRHPSWNDC